MLRAFRYWRAARGLAGLMAMALLVGACSMASFPAFRPGKPQAVAIAVAEADAASATPAPPPAAAAPAYVPLAFVPAQSRVTSVDGLIAKYAAAYGVPEMLIRRVVQKESGYNPGARNGPFLGLMQIRHDTARSMGYRGSAEGLLDADTNLKYGVKYLRGAWLVAGRNADRAIRHYSRGYYYDAKRLGLLDEIGL